jgi:hypothetical protein
MDFNEFEAKVCELGQDVAGYANRRESLFQTYLEQTAGFRFRCCGGLLY